MVKPYLEGSITLSKFISAYGSSMTGKASYAVGTWYRSSFLFEMFKNFAEKKPTYSFSKTFKTAEFLAAKADRLADLTHGCISAAVDTSTIGMLCKAFIAESRSNLSRMLAAVLISFSAGYCSVVAANGLWSRRTLLFILIPALPGLLLLVIGDRWKTWLSNSAVTSIYKYISE